MQPRKPPPNHSILPPHPLPAAGQPPTACPPIVPVDVCVRNQLEPEDADLRCVAAEWRYLENSVTSAAEQTTMGRQPTTWACKLGSSSAHASLGGVWVAWTQLRTPSQCSKTLKLAAMFSAKRAAARPRCCCMAKQGTKKNF